MDLTTPLLGNKVVSWTTGILKNARKETEKTNISFAHGRQWVAKATGALVLDAAVGAVTVPAFLIANPGKNLAKTCAKDEAAFKAKTEILTLKKIGLLALRVITAAFVALAALVAGLFNPKAAISLLEASKLLPKKTDDDYLEFSDEDPVADLTDAALEKVKEDQINDQKDLLEEQKDQIEAQQDQIEAQQDQIQSNEEHEVQEEIIQEEAKVEEAKVEEALEETNKAPVEEVHQEIVDGQIIVKEDQPGLVPEAVNQ